MNDSPYQWLRQIESALNGLDLISNAEAVGAPAYRAAVALEKHMRLTQSTVRDYERSEEPNAAAKLLPRSIKSLEQLRESILAVSQYNLLSAVDVAQLTAGIDALIDRLR